MKKLKSSSENKDKNQLWWEQGLRFECQGSGQCCTSHGEYGFVYLTLEDRRRMAEELGLSTAEFTKKYCDRKSGIWHLIERTENPDCLFLKNKKCTIYKARPTQCRTWPFWPEVMEAKTWKKEVASFCPGVGKGKTHSAEEIASALAEQINSENQLLNERLSSLKK